MDEICGFAPICRTRFAGMHDEPAAGGRDTRVCTGGHAAGGRAAGSRPFAGRYLRACTLSYQSPDNLGCGYQKSPISHSRHSGFKAQAIPKHVNRRIDLARLWLSAYLTAGVAPIVRLSFPATTFVVGVVAFECIPFGASHGCRTVRAPAETLAQHGEAESRSDAQRRG